MPRQSNQIKRKPGRPKLAEDQVKVKIAPIRFTGAEYERITKAAQKADQTVSQWIRGMLNAAVKG